jgi:membrane-bound lytic murein transglycosylase B
VSQDLLSIEHLRSDWGFSVKPKILFVSASILLSLSLSGCASEADAIAVTTMKCDHVQFIVATQNKWFQKDRSQTVENLEGQVKSKGITQVQADRRFASTVQSLLEVSRDVGMNGDPSQKPTEAFGDAAKRYRDAVVDEATMRNPFLDEVFASCEAVGVVIDTTAFEPDRYR